MHLLKGQDAFPPNAATYAYKWSNARSRDHERCVAVLTVSGKGRLLSPVVVFAAVADILSRAKALLPRRLSLRAFGSSTEQTLSLIHI